MGWGTLNAIPEILAALILVYWAVILIVLVNDGRDPTGTLVWLFFLTVFPVFGLIFYFFFGRNWKKKTMKGTWIREVRRIAEPVMLRIQQRYLADSEQARTWARKGGYATLTTLIQTADNSVPLPAYDVDIMPSGAEKFEKLLADLSRARDTVNIEYFIWERDELTARITRSCWTALLPESKSEC